MHIVFLDRDGVINYNREDYVRNTDEFVFIPGSKEAAAKLASAGWKIAVVSNQSCIGKGLMSLDELNSIDRYLKDEIALAGGSISGIYYCLHGPEDNCDCRKPAPGLIFRASRELDVDLEGSVFVGDSPVDIQAGHAAGCRTVAVLSGRLTADEASMLEPAPDYIAADLAEAVEWILSK